MLTAHLFRVSSHLKRNINFFPKAKILLTSKTLVILNQAFLCSVNESPDTIAVFQKRESIPEMYYRHYLLNNSEYANLIFRQGIETNSKTASILNQLDQERENNSNLKDQLSDHLDRELNQLSFSELCEVTFLVTKLVRQNNSDPVWEKILESINKECLTRIPSWTVDELIKMIYVSMLLKQHLKFRRKLMNKLVKKSSSSQQIVFLFYFLLRRKFSVSKENLFDLQKKIIKILPDVNYTEIGIIAEGLHKSFKHLQHEQVLHNILMRGLEVKTLEQIPFWSLCKFARMKAKFYNFEGISEFQKNSIETALRLGLEEIILLALSGDKVRYLDSNLRTILMKEVKNHIRQLSAFYIERVAYITTSFNIHDEEFLKLAVDVFETLVPKKNTQSFLLFLNHLIHHNMYPKNLINLVLEQEFVEKTIDFGNQYAHAWWFLYCTLDIERPEYLTFDLDPTLRKKIYKLSKVRLHNVFSRHHSCLWKVESMLIKLFGEGTVKYITPLPHCPIGLLMRFDKNLKPQKFPEEFETCIKSFVTKPLKDDHIWVFIVWAPSSFFTDISNTIPNFAFQTQLRQLNAIGYTPLPVNINFSHKIASVNKQKELDFENLISAKLEECCKNQNGAVTK